MSETIEASSELEVPLSCNLNALDADSRLEHISNGGNLLSVGAQERQESPDGLSFRFTAADYPRVVAFIANERLCCPFFRFTLDVSPDRRPIWLHITGGEAAKLFLKAELSLIE